jgi:hypothetical protein
MDHATWVPAATFAVGLAAIFWRSGAVITTLQVLLAKLTDKVVGLEADVKELQKAQPVRARRRKS